MWRDTCPSRSFLSARGPAGVQSLGRDSATTPAWDPPAAKRMSPGTCAWDKWWGGTQWGPAKWTGRPTVTPQGLCEQESHWKTAACPSMPHIHTLKKRWGCMSASFAMLSFNSHLRFLFPPLLVPKSAVSLSFCPGFLPRVLTLPLCPLAQPSVSLHGSGPCGPCPARCAGVANTSISRTPRRTKPLPPLLTNAIDICWLIHGLQGLQAVNWGVLWQETRPVD